MLRFYFFIFLFLIAGSANAELDGWMSQFGGACFSSEMEACLPQKPFGRDTTGFYSDTNYTFEYSHSTRVSSTHDQCKWDTQVEIINHEDPYYNSTTSIIMSGGGILKCDYVNPCEDQEDLQTASMYSISKDDFDSGGSTPPLYQNIGGCAAKMADASTDDCFTDGVTVHCAATYSFTGAEATDSQPEPQYTEPNNITSTTDTPVVTSSPTSVTSTPSSDGSTETITTNSSTSSTDESIEITNNNTQNVEITYIGDKSVTTTIIDGVVTYNDGTYQTYTNTSTVDSGQTTVDVKLDTTVRPPVSTVDTTVIPPSTDSTSSKVDYNSDGSVSGSSTTSTGTGGVDGNGSGSGTGDLNSPSPSDPPPEPEPKCGVAGKPPCTVKIDETGTPTASTVDFKDDFDSIGFDSFIETIGDIDISGAPKVGDFSVSSFFPTPSCSNYSSTIFGYPVVVELTNLSPLRSIMAFLAYGLTAAGIISLIFRRAV